MLYYTVQRLTNANSVDFIDIKTYAAKDLTTAVVDWNTYRAPANNASYDARPNGFVLNVQELGMQFIFQPETVLDPASADPSNPDTLVTVTGDPITDLTALSIALNDILFVCCP